MFLWVPMFAEAQDSAKKTQAEQKEMQLLSRLKKTKIVLKDGTIKKNCSVIEIKDYWIVYEKEGSLHDLMIEQIERIEIMDEKKQAVFFDKRNKPEISSYVL